MSHAHTQIPLPHILLLQTTLLDVLAGRKTVGEVSGVVSYSSIRPTQRFLRRFVGYVEQHGESSFASQPAPGMLVPAALLGPAPCHPAMFAQRLCGSMG